MNLVHIGVAFGLMALSYSCVAFPSGQLSDKFVSIDGNAMLSRWCCQFTWMLNAFSAVGSSRRSACVRGMCLES